ncbi:MAG: hypothetical protein ACREV1_03045, partial [Gammaproteobacteria bacterium]
GALGRQARGGPRVAIRRHRIGRASLLILLLGFSLGIFIETIVLVRASTHNRAIERLLTGEDIPVTEDEPEVMFARAHWLMQKNRGDEAIELFNRLEGKGDPEFRARLHYNLGNLYLTRAIALTERSEFAHAFTLTMLAKDLYREALRLDSRDWDAKYNLEVAMRLVPDLPQAETDEPDKQRRQQGLWSSIPGFPRGLP